MKITQKEVIGRIYSKKKQQWLVSNKEELSTGEVEFKNGVRFERSQEDGILKPFYCFRKFDSNVTVRASLSVNVKNNFDLELSKSVLGDKEYYVVKNQKISK